MCKKWVHLCSAQSNLLYCFSFHTVCYYDFYSSFLRLHFLLLMTSIVLFHLYNYCQCVNFFWCYLCTSCSLFFVIFFKYIPFMTFSITVQNSSLYQPFSQSHFPQLLYFHTYSFVSENVSSPTAI